MNSPDRPEPDAQETPLLVEADCVADATGSHTPGALLIDRSGPDPVVLARGAPGEVRSHPRAEGAERRLLKGSTLIPALVNAHVHLDLTHIGPRPFERAAGFVPWVEMVRAERSTDVAGIRSSVREGIRMSRVGGVALVGDIAGAGSTVPGDELERSELRGASFVEFFGLGKRQQATIDAMREALDSVRSTSAVMHSLQPHAPYSAGLRVYDHAAIEAASHPIMTHLAEVPEEVEFVRTCGGPFREMLERIGVWDDSICDDFAGHASPVEHLAPTLGPHMIAAHVNVASDTDLDILSEKSVRVVYCPRCSDYFGRHHDFGPHRYRDMMGMGINVSLGTDSIINLPSGTERISTLDEMAFLRARDGTDSTTLLAMATTEGANALAFDPSLFTFAEGPVAGVLAIPGATLDDALAKAGEIAWIA